MLSLHPSLEKAGTCESKQPGVCPSIRVKTGDRFSHFTIEQAHFSEDTEKLVIPRLQYNSSGLIPIHGSVL